MNLLKFLQSLRRSRPFDASAPGDSMQSPPAAPAPDVDAARLSRLDVQNAITLHLEWRMLFNEMLSNEELPAADAMPDAQQSGLGRWLMLVQRQGRDGHPAFAAIAVEHQQLHSLAAQALEHARDNRLDLASTLLNTRFERSHRQLVQLLNSLIDA